MQYTSMIDYGHLHIKVTVPFHQHYILPQLL